MRGGPMGVLAADPVRAETATPEVSVVMPCLDEADTLATCISKVQRVFAEQELDGEIIVADNGSTDGSQDIARAMGARVVPVEERGYGNALMGGIRAARGKYVVMGDADDSYDWLELPAFVVKLREGYELVQGCRLERGGGQVKPGAMPVLHRRWGNPMFSFFARLWFKAPFTDVYCGFRGFSKEFWLDLGQRAGGMEFATEMIIRARARRSRMTEVPITLHPDGRVSHPPHLRTFRDGWRTLRFFLMYSARWLFFIPGALLVGLGLLGFALALPNVTIFDATLDAHTLVFSSLAILCGYQAILFAIFTKTLAMSEFAWHRNPRWVRFFDVVNLERGILAGGIALLAGLVLLGLAVNEWRQAEFGRLNYSETMKLVIPGATLTAVAVQTILSSFFVSILGTRGR